MLELRYRIGSMSQCIYHHNLQQSYFTIKQISKMSMEEYIPLRRVLGEARLLVNFQSLNRQVYVYHGSLK